MTSTKAQPVFALLFVCTGNICRSPTAHGIFEQLIRQQGLQTRIRVDSAAIQAYHVGEAPDPRSQRVALQRGVDLSRQRARQVEAEDFLRYTHIVAMDEGHKRALRQLQASTPKARAELFCLLDVLVHVSDKNVPDPYYGDLQDFERVFDLCEQACSALLEKLVVDTR